MKDSDGDGIEDFDEKNLDTDPLNSDTDNDGIADGEELKIKTDPLNPDTDEDGTIDGEDQLPLDAEGSNVMMEMELRTSKILMMIMMDNR